MNVNYIENVDSLKGLKNLPSKSINCSISSPPYLNMRNYGIEGEFGCAETPEEFVNQLCDYYDEVYRVLKDDGVVFVNLGDTYLGSGKGVWKGKENTKKESFKFTEKPKEKLGGWRKQKQLALIPFRFAIEMQNRGWLLRNNIVWCLSGQTELYCKNNSTNKISVRNIKDLYRTNYHDISLWTGEKWTPITHMVKKPQKERGVEILLRSGEKILATSDHIFPLKNGNEKRVSELNVGDILTSCILPNNDKKCQYIQNDMAWFLGLFLAEGSFSSDDKIQISGHIKENEYRLSKIQKLAESFDGCNATLYCEGNKSTIGLKSNIIKSIIDHYIGGKNAKGKFLNNTVWNRDNMFLENLLQGYLDGDGHYDEKNNRYRLSFCYNKKLASSFRTLSARLGVKLVLNKRFASYQGKKFPAYHGEIRMIHVNHHNCNDKMEIVGIRESNINTFYDISIDCDKHLFSLASGTLTHNCKPNALPQSCTDRFTVDFETIFMFTKNKKYFFNQQIEPFANASNPDEIYTGEATKDYESSNAQNPSDTKRRILESMKKRGGRSMRAVWKINTKPNKSVHTATFPEELVERMLKSGCPEEGVVLDFFMGSGTTGIVAKRLGMNYIGFDLNPEYCKIARKRIEES